MSDRRITPLELSSW